MAERWSAKLEPFIIKNLETIQGDERDIVIISTVYGPDASGNVYQRFGPINSKMGWRRLNVLFTRAKRRVEVMTSLAAGDVIVDEGSSRGVRAFKEYLEYAASGRIERGVISGREPDSDFEVYVAELLSRAGYQCVPQVGVAGFFIDIGVIDPRDPGRFILGIECDGATYHSRARPLVTEIASKMRFSEAGAGSCIGSGRLIGLPIRRARRRRSSRNSTTQIGAHRHGGWSFGR